MESRTQNQINNSVAQTQGPSPLDLDKVIDKLPISTEEYTPSPEEHLTVGQRIGRIFAYVPRDSVPQFMRQVITFGTAPVIVRQLPRQLARNNNVFNAVIRAHHEFLFNETWDENLTDAVREYTLVNSECETMTVQLVQRQHNANI